MGHLFHLAAGLAFFLYGIGRMNFLLSQLSTGQIETLLLRYARKDWIKFIIAFIATILFQSSSATTVILVSMASAGLITAAQSVSFILGANLGAVSTAWIVAWKITALALPLFITGVLGTVVTTQRKMRTLFLFFIALGLILYGLGLMSSAVNGLSENQALLSFLSSFKVEHSFVTLLFVTMIGVLFTIVVQSSGATLAMVIAGTATGLLTLHTAAALILGATLGTTVTALLAAITSGCDGRRTAFIHFSINVFGIATGIILFYPFVGLSVYAAAFLGTVSPQIILALYATLQKVWLCSALYPFRKTIYRVAAACIRTRFSEQTSRLTIPPVPRDADRALIIDILSKNTDILILYLRDMLSFSYILIFKHKERTLWERIEKYEAYLDTGTREIAGFISESTNVAPEYLWTYLKISDETESISDHAKDIAKYGLRLGTGKRAPKPDEIMPIKHAYHSLAPLFNAVCIKKEVDPVHFDRIKELESFIHKSKQELFSKFTCHCAEDTDNILLVIDILSEYHKIVHCIKGILQTRIQPEKTEPDTLKIPS